jgi:phospholipid/cholesterol/gamma-HCH transport system substrate-binding protein
VGAIAGFIFLGARSMQHATLSYKTFFDESVQGLDVGAPVKFRGVTIGNVAAIEIAPDRRHVEIGMELTLDDLARLGLGEKSELKRGRFEVPSDLRTQLGSQGITGVKFVQIDFFDTKTNPPPVLPFETPSNYIPSAVSTMKNIEDAVVTAVNQIPEIAQQINSALQKITRILEDIEGQKLPQQVVAILLRASQTLSSVENAVTHADLPKLSRGAQKTIADLNVAVNKLDKMIDHVDGKDGVLASAQRTSDSLGEVARGAKGTGHEMESTLREIREAAESVKRLADALERDPDMLVKGSGRKGP